MFDYTAAREWVNQHHETKQTSQYMILFYRIVYFFLIFYWQTRALPFGLLGKHMTLIAQSQWLFQQRHLLKLEPRSDLQWALQLVITDLCHGRRVLGLEKYLCTIGLLPDRQVLALESFFCLWQWYCARWQRLHQTQPPIPCTHFQIEYRVC